MPDSALLFITLALEQGTIKPKKASNRHTLLLAYYLPKQIVFLYLQTLSSYSPPRELQQLYGVVLLCQVLPVKNLKILQILPISHRHRTGISCPGFPSTRWRCSVRVRLPSAPAWARTICRSESVLLEKAFKIN